MSHWNYRIGFEDEHSLDGWCWDDSSHTVEVFNTKDVILGDDE